LNHSSFDHLSSPKAGEMHIRGDSPHIVNGFGESEGQGYLSLIQPLVND